VSRAAYRRRGFGSLWAAGLCRNQRCLARLFPTALSRSARTRWLGQTWPQLWRQGRWLVWCRL